MAISANNTDYYFVPNIDRGIGLQENRHFFPQKTGQNSHFFRRKLVKIAILFCRNLSKSPFFP
jgi:hypothetical protein